MYSMSGHKPMRTAFCTGIDQGPIFDVYSPTYEKPLSHRAGSVFEVLAV